jgi:hypothetical protein
MMFQVNMLLPSSAGSSCHLLHCACLVLLFFGPEDGGDMYLLIIFDFHWITWWYIPKDELFLKKAFLAVSHSS